MVTTLLIRHLAEDCCCLEEHGLELGLYKCHQKLLELCFSNNTSSASQRCLGKDFVTVS